MSEITRLLRAIDRGDREVTAGLLALVYEELRALARAHMAHERLSHTLDATALVHEAYMRLVSQADRRWENQRHFFAAAGEAMRRILVEHARARNAQKRGGGRERVALEDGLPEIASPCAEFEDIRALDEALTALAAHDAELAQLVNLLYFAGMKLEEAAAAIGVSRSSAYRSWLYARAWLHDALAGNADKKKSVDGPETQDKWNTHSAI